MLRIPPKDVQKSTELGPTRPVHSSWAGRVDLLPSAGYLWGWADCLWSCGTPSNVLFHRPINVGAVVAAPPSPEPGLLAREPTMREFQEAAKISKEGRGGVASRPPLREFRDNREGVGKHLPGRARPSAPLPPWTHRDAVGASPAAPKPGGVAWRATGHLKVPREYPEVSDEPELLTGLTPPQIIQSRVPVSTQRVLFSGGRSAGQVLDGDARREPVAPQSCTSPGNSG